MKLLTELHLMMERADFQYIASELIKYYNLKSKVKMGSRNQGVSVLHEIHHAVQRKKFGVKKFLKKYNQASNMADLRGKDRYLHNKWERKAENWANQEYNRKWKNKF